MTNLLNDRAPALPDPLHAGAAAAAVTAAVVTEPPAVVPAGRAAVLRLVPPLPPASRAPGRADVDALPAVREFGSALGPLLLRPMQAADARAHAAFLDALGEDGRRRRLFALPPTLRLAAGGVDDGARLTLLLLPALAAEVDEIAAVPAVDIPAGGVLGELCVCIDRGRVAAEFALSVLPERQGRGLGHLLMACLLDACLTRRVALMCASVPAGAAAMLALARACGFQVLRAADGTAQLALMLRPRGVR
jgi:acetyltransferase